MPKVSILIPCYNVEKFIRQCMNSVVNQTLHDIEIICVNDGSTDSTLDILREYEDRDSRVKVISKHNSGYGASMNIALESAKGEFIGIVESDDYADLNMFENLYNLALKHNVDIVKGDWYSYYGEEDKLVENNHFSEFEEEVVLDPKISKNIFVIPSLIAASIYKKTFLDKYAIRFLETPGASYQDTAFAAKTIMAVDKLVLTKKNYYCYRVDNQNSSVKSSAKVFCICDEYNEINSFMDKYPEMKSTLEEQKCANQYREYLWNLNRLEEKESKEFFKVFRTEFKKYYDSDILKDEFFARYPKRDVLRLINNPSKFYKKEYLKQDVTPIVSISHGIFRIQVDNHKLLSFNARKRFKKLSELIIYCKDKKKLKEIIKGRDESKILVMTPFIPYYSSMKQRFQHIAENLSKMGYLVFYCTYPSEDKQQSKWSGFLKLSDTLYLCDNFRLLRKKLKNAWFYYTPIQNFTEKSFYKVKKNNKIVYDHIDSFKVGDVKDKLFYYNRHKNIAKDCDVILYSARGLKEDFDGIINDDSKMHLVNNGVDFEHFNSKSINKEFAGKLNKLKSQSRFLVGYYGAFADWLDYDLLEYMIQNKSDIGFVFIGQCYAPNDYEKMDKIARYSNVYYIPPVEYNKLPEYASLFDVCIIPFKECEVARYTNPIKLFEYMAMGKPVVVTKDLIECYGYDGVFVAGNYEDFTNKLEEAYSNSERGMFVDKLIHYAMANTWNENCRKIATILDNSYLKGHK